ncbi:porin family protein [Flavivirga eckloniae]|uniref:Outer membrane protein beta-barrel domain-containing protein n=1 Tax=Flavivirga eckloniae TaxID=1803846 RepID=A0A2K9PU85_9FLAO|nr:porin family protein [Flavivirga eckloniae]AUP80635.1 hypothetical protein C1H87_18725 [Flavivirga eckloniae]
MTKKAKLFTFFILSILWMSNAQSGGSSDFEFGIKGGANLSGFRNVSSKYKAGISAGLFVQCQVSDRVSLQSELLYNAFGGKAKNNNQKTKLNYASFVPVKLKYQLFDLLKIGIGPQISYLVSAKGRGVSKKNFNKLDFGGVAGLEIELVEKLNVFAQYYYGVRDISKAPGKVSNKAIQVGLAYSF